MMPASDTIRKLRINLMLEQEEFAEKIGVTKSAISKYEAGVIKPRLPKIRAMIQLAKENNLQIKLEDFFD